jgi:hypothetical protein
MATASRSRQVSSRRRLNLTVEKSREGVFIYSILFPILPIPAFIVPLIEQLCYPDAISAIGQFGRASMSNESRWPRVKR